MLRQAEVNLALRRGGLEQSPRLTSAPVTHARHGLEVTARHFFATQKQVVQCAQRFLAHALFQHRGRSAVAAERVITEVCPGAGKAGDGPAALICFINSLKT